MDISIRLQDSLNAKAFEPAELIHPTEIEEVCLLIDNQLEFVDQDNCKNQPFNVRLHNTISVFGDRGAGKTSFLYTLALKYQKDTWKGVKVLDIIDPTLIEEKGHIFLLIIARIDKLVTEALKDDGEYSEKAKRWSKKKKDLSKGLPSLDHVGLTYEEPQWQEDAFIMEKGIEAVNASFDLERNFHELIGIALEILNKKAFMLMFDDIDVDFKKGWHVLEVIRKYLTTPRIIVILSGNLQLYTLNVRRHQWQNFGKALLKNEADIEQQTHDSYIKLVSEIESQYLLKILKTENRIHLHTIGELLSLNPEMTIKIQRDETSEETDILSAYYNVLTKNGIVNRSIARLFCSFLLNTSARTQIHFLYDGLGQNASNLSAINAFVSRIYAQNINIGLSISSRLLNVQILRYLISNKIMEEAYQLLPNFDDDDINSALTGLTIIFSQRVKEGPEVIFDYWSRVCFIRNFTSILPYMVDSSNMRERNLNNLCLMTGAYQTRELRSIVGNGLAYIVNEKQNSAIPIGCINLMGYASTAKAGNTEKRIDNVLKAAASPYQRILGYLPLVTLSSGIRNERYLYYSFFCLIASIGDIATSIKDGSDGSSAIAEAQMAKCYQMSNHGQMLNDDVDDEDFNESDEIDGQEDAHARRMIAEDCKAWVGKYPFYNNDINDIKSSTTHLYGKIATRTYYSITNLLETNTNTLVGDLLNLCVAAFFNACVVEEAKERLAYWANEKGKHVTMQGININNVRKKPKVLLDNLKYINDNNVQEALPFSRWILSCPLLFPYTSIITEEPYLNFVGEQIDAMYAAIDMPTFLNSIARKNDRADMPRFSFANDKINKTIQLIKGERLNMSTIMTGDIDEAVDELKKVFQSCSENSLNRFREKCELKNGAITVKNIYK